MSFCNPRTQAGTAMGRAVKGVVTRKRKGVVFARWTTRGKRHEVQLGRETDRQAVQMELSRLHARLAADPDYGPRHTNELILAELCEAFLREKPYAPGEHTKYKSALVRLLSDTERASLACSEFGPRALADYRDELCRLRDSDGELVYSRSYVGKVLRIIRTVYKWGAETERIEAECWHCLESVRGPRADQGKAPRGRKTIPGERLASLIAELPEGAGRLALALRWTGARPSELYGLRLCDLDRSNPQSWLLRLSKHKTVNSGGRDRVVVFGPQAQRAIRVELGEREYQFAPEPCRNGAAGRGVYCGSSLGWAFRRACDRLGCERYGPYALRHTRLEEVRRLHGPEAAQAVGGHKRIHTTEIYAPVSLGRAVSAAEGSG